jgi:hypothetical protein
MPLSPDLWTAYDPPAIWVHLDQPISQEANSRTLTVRVKETGKRSVSAQVTLDRYCPEDTVFRAISEMLKALAVEQRAVSAHSLGAELTVAVLRWVEPF